MSTFVIGADGKARSSGRHRHDLGAGASIHSEREPVPAMVRVARVADRHHDPIDAGAQQDRNGKHAERGEGLTTFVPKDRGSVHEHPDGVIAAHEHAGLGIPVREHPRAGALTDVLERRAVRWRHRAVVPAVRVVQLEEVLLAALHPGPRVIELAFQTRGRLLGRRGAGNEPVEGRQRERTLDLPLQGRIDLPPERPVLVPERDRLRVLFGEGAPVEDEGLPKRDRSSR